MGLPRRYAPRSDEGVGAVLMSCHDEAQRAVAIFCDGTARSLRASVTWLRRRDAKVLAYFCRNKRYTGLWVSSTYGKPKVSKNLANALSSLAGTCKPTKMRP